MSDTLKPPVKQAQPQQQPQPQPIDAEQRTLLVEQGREYLIKWALSDPEEIKKGIKLSWLENHFLKALKEKEIDSRLDVFFDRPPADVDNWFYWLFQTCGWEEFGFHPMDAWFRPPASWNEGIDAVAKARAQAEAEWLGLMQDTGEQAFVQAFARAKI